MNLEEEAKKINDKWNLKTLMEEVMKTSHPESAPETLKRLGEQDTQLAILKTEQSNLMDKINGVEVKVDKLDEKMDKGFEEIKDLLKSGLEAKADKWIERVMVWLGIIIGGGTITYVGGLLIKLIEMK